MSDSKSTKSNSSSEKEKVGIIDESRPDEAVIALSQKQALDVSLQLPGMMGDHEDEELDPKESQRVKRKLDKRILPILFLLYTVQYMDKNGIGASAILGFLPDNKLNIDQFNRLSTIFYAGLLVSQWPHSWALQRFPVAKYISCMIFLWSLLVGMHIVAKSYSGLIAIRFFLGFTEGCVTPGLMLITSMFYTRVEIAERIGWSFQCNGLAQIITSFISFGVFHAPAHTPATPQKMAQWQWFFLVITLITFFTGIIFVTLFPDSPTRAKFLTEQDKVTVIKRMKVNQSGVETKVWKWEQFYAVFKDPKTYFFFFFAAFLNLIGGVGTQFALIIRDFGFTTLETTLLSIPPGCAMIISITTGCYLLRKFPNSRTWIAVGSYAPSIISAILLITLPSSARIGLLTSFYTLQLGQAPAVIMSLSWVTATVSGHTKKVVTNAIWLVGYSVGQMCAPLFWRNEYKPRNRVPWLIILGSYAVQIVIILGLRFYLNSVNIARDRQHAEAEAAHPAPAHGSKENPHPDLAPYLSYSIIEVPDQSAPNGVRRERIEKRFLDITDMEDLSFRYVL